ncbi:MAG TPA: hypothetical protein VJ810_27190, partial [Blastocatellia bacterium]|nr:hypothetical protein [Blastocatellia bacterium]
PETEKRYFNPIRASLIHRVSGKGEIDRENGKQIIEGVSAALFFDDGAAAGSGIGGGPGAVVDTRCG